MKIDIFVIFEKICSQIYNKEPMEVLLELLEKYTIENLYKIEPFVSELSPEAKILFDDYMKQVKKAVAKGQ
jgi:hypothetical protein